jgi:hypothetical protein
VIEDLRMVDPAEKAVRRCRYFTWLPEPEICDKFFVPDSVEAYTNFYNQSPGNCMRMPLFYRITEDNERIFESYYTTKLYEGGLFSKTCRFFVDAIDDGLEIPLIFTKVRMSDGGFNSCKE